jgi:hypothetical protein
VARTPRQEAADELGDEFPGPVLRRMLEIGADVHSGRADAETVKAWEGLRESMESCMDALEAALAPYPDDMHDEMTRKWVEEVMSKMDWSALFPTVH